MEAVHSCEMIEHMHFIGRVESGRLWYVLCYC